MALAARSVPDGVGYSKKHDAPNNNYNAGRSRSILSSFRRRRLALVLVAFAAIWFFVKNIPTDLPPVSERYNPNLGYMAPGHVLASHGLQHDNDADMKDSPEQKQEGPIQFYNLASSLRPHLLKDATDNVLILLPDLLSTSAFVPFACQMAQNNRSSIHVAILGRQNVEFEEILKIYGINVDDCPIFWHDARPDHHMESSRSRIETSVQSGFAHCSIALRPRLVIVDERFDENTQIGKKLHAIAVGARITILTLPSNVQQSLPWIATLDSNSLLKLNEVEIEVVIQAYPESAGTLIRLLRSMESADYAGLYIPRLTIELPAYIDPFVTDYLQRFRWPPSSPAAASRLTIRHRVNSNKRESAEASLHTIQSFYPRSAGTSHVLLLSPDTELSSSYFHYLVLTLLEYKYSSTHEDQSQQLFGISLELPEHSLSDLAPSLASLSDKETFVLSQTPNSNAALITGESWRDLHTFLTERSIRDPDLVHKSDFASSITDGYPGWLAEALDFMQAQGQYMLYPAFTTTKNLKLVTLHRELHQMPEEYVQSDADKKQTKALNVDSIMHNDVLTGEIDLPVGNDNAAPMNNGLPMQVLLSHGQKSAKQVLPALSEIPLYNFAGKPTEWSQSSLAASKFSDNFSLHQGGCSSLEARNGADKGLIRYMFCEVG